jgi:hypothetical protein
MIIPIVSSIFLIFAIVIEIMIIKICLRKISSQTYFNYYNKDTWVIIVIFGSIFGQLMYLVMKGNGRIFK